jgi:singapore isolate B (sub-type 7) whole genome shotgun sequence assembly, scaffold_17
MKNCPTAILSQYGVWRINGTVVPLYDTLGPEALA